MSAPTSYNRQNSRTPSKNSRLKSGLKDFKNSKYDTAKINYTAVGWGNDHGSVTMGQIHKDSDVTAAVMLNTRDGLHQFSLDNDGVRRGSTTSTSTGSFQVKCGKYPWIEKAVDKEALDSCFIEAEHGNIVIKASNGKIRLEATDIEMVAKGETTDRGNIKMTASENIIMESKKTLINAKNFYKMSTPQTMEIIANGVLKLYGKTIRGVTDAVDIKDSKVGGRNFQQRVKEGA
tara:strand:- start:285 stop:983 length:699 start_codon:yes stop_codon:yes gene_type:complete